MSGAIGASQAGANNSNPLDVAAHGAWGVLHPNSQAQLDVQGENATHLTDLFDKIIPAAADNAPITVVFQAPNGPMPITLTAGGWKKLGKDTVYENATDPLNLLFLSGAARRTATKLAGTGLEAAANAVAHGLETPARVGAQAYQAIPGAVEKAGNALLTPAAKLVTAGIKLPDIEKTKRELQAAVQAGRTEDAARLQAQLERETTKVSHGALGRIYRMRKQGEGAGTQFMNAVRSNPYARRGLTQQSVRGVEGADNIAHNYVRELAQQEDDVAARNEQAIYDAEQAAIAKRDALLAQGNRKAADAVESELPPEVTQFNNRMGWIRASGPVRKGMEDAKVYEPTQWERENIPVIGTMVAYKKNYVPHHTILESREEGELLPGEERSTAYRVNPSTQGIHSQNIPEPLGDVPLMDRLRNKWAKDLREIGPTGNNMLAKSIHLNGTPNGGIKGLSEIAPDTELTQRELNSARLADNPAEVQRLQAKLDSQMQEAAAQKARMLSRTRTGVETQPLAPLREALGTMGQAGQYLTQEQLEKANFPQALENLGLTPERLAELQGLRTTPRVGRHEPWRDNPKRPRRSVPQSSLAAHRGNGLIMPTKTI